MIKQFLFCIGLAFLLGMTGTSSWAHDATFGSQSDPVLLTLGISDSIDHLDGDDYKGWLNVFVKNTGTEKWGDFHFQIIPVGQDTVDSIANVSFLDGSSGAYDPTYTNYSSATTKLDDWSIDNDILGATIDLYFYDNPVAPGDIVEFSVYTDNSSDNVDLRVDAFGTAFYPTPVPVPATVWLLGSSLLGLVGLKRKK